MAQKRVTLSIDSELNDRWANVAKRLKMTKSGMVKEYLEHILPILEKQEPKDVLASAFRELGSSISEVGGLFDGIEEK